MKLSEMVEILNSDKKLMTVMVEKCTQEIKPIKEKRVVWKHEFQYQEGEEYGYIPERQIDDIYSDIIHEAGIKEYNDIRIAELLLDGYPFNKITFELSVRRDHVQSIKKKIYEALKRSKDE